MDNHAKCHSFKLWACLLMTGSHIILATLRLPNGLSAPCRLSLLSCFSFNYTKAKHSFSQPVFDFSLFVSSCCLTPLYISLSAAAILTVFPPLQPTISPSPSYYPCFPAPISVSPASFRSNECSLRWGWPEVSWREAGRLMRIATSLFCLRCKKRVNGRVKERKRESEGPDRQTHWHTALTFAIMNLADANCTRVWQCDR